MAKQRAPLEFNSLGGGLITEASPLTFPDNASLDEVNFTINSDGTRSRRLGIELEQDAIQMALGQSYLNGEPDVVSSFLWENVSGENITSLLVVQTSDKIHIFKTTDTNTSRHRVYQKDLPEFYTGVPFSFASVDGTLVIVTGGQEVLTLVADLSNADLPTFELYQARLTIRDLFGTDALYNREAEGGTGYVELTDPEYIAKRPLASGLQSEENTVDPLPVTSNATETITSGAFGSLSPGQTETKTYTSGATTARQGFSPASVYGHTISGITASRWELLDYMGVPISSGNNNAVIQFTTVPEYSSIAVDDLSSGKSYTFTQSLSDGRTFTSAYIPEWESAVTSPFNLVFTVDSSTVDAIVYNYNLRNQTFGVKRLPKTGTISVDPIASFIDLAGKLPSMSDSVLSALYNNVEDSGNKTADRFHAEDLIENPLGTAPAPKGYFIIDALNRSESRQTRWAELIDDQNLGDTAVVLPTDITPKGPKALAEYSGRLWYGGFSEVGTLTVGGGTRLESYLLFSQLATSKSVLTRCYQKGDPTSLEAPELLETDGGFLSLDGAYGIKKMVNIGTALLVFAENGVWSVTGNDGNYFTPTSPRVTKINNKGSVGPNSVVVVDNAVVYWARDGIYMIQVGELGEYKQDNLTEKTIQTLYSEFDFNAKSVASGAYDPYRNAVDWAVHNTIDRPTETEILTLKTDTGAFTRSVVSDGGTERTFVGFATLPPYTLGGSAGLVTVNGVVVTADGADVIASRLTIEPSTVTTKGVVVSKTHIGGLSLLSFVESTNQDFLDWGEVDAPAYIVTGYVSGGDLQRHKQVPYITAHFERTEDGFELDGDDIVPSSQSSCIMQAQWDWANSANSGRWSREFQAYRYRRHYIPADISDPYDYGFETIVTKNKIRGKGRVLSLKFSTEEGKDCRILGWSAMMGVNNDV